MALTLEDLHGRVLDVDSHEQMAGGRWLEVFGDRYQRFAEYSDMLLQLSLAQAAAAADAPDGTDVLTWNPTDTQELTPETVWEKKLNGAPGTNDMDRRPDVLDVMGIQRALVFPGMALVAMVQGLGGLGGPVRTTDEQQRLAWAAVDAHNEWACEFTRKYPDRLRMVGVLGTGKAGATPEWIVKETERLISTGVKAIQIPVGLAPAGLSPADRKLDPFYATLAAANVALVSHPPSTMNFTSEQWSDLDFNLGVSHIAVENFLRMMTLGGVFERHPNLRFGAIETGASWIGPLADWMDWVVDEERAPEDSRAVLVAKLSMKPSEYLARHVRVSPFNFEPVEVWLERYPHLQDVYCYSTDYPHFEGMPWSLRKFYEIVSPLGDDVVEKFFCTNAQLLLE